MDFDSVLRKTHHVHMNENPNATLHVGLDEAGRGCILGPMVIAIVSTTTEDRRWFTEIGVRDSKLLSSKKREDLGARIRERCWYRLAIAHPLEIDNAVRGDGTSLNTLEQDLMSSLIRTFQASFADTDAYILSDAIGRYPEHHAMRLRERCIAIPHHAIESRISADRIDSTVGAASILAKCERERLLSLLQRTTTIDFGSGYASDKKAIAFVRQCEPDSPIVRWSWKLHKEEGLLGL